MMMTHEEAARECARHIYDSEANQNGYDQFIDWGNDPRQHILYAAALVLGYQKDFKEDIQTYKKLKKEEESTVL